MHVLHILDLIELKTTGIIYLLDEECKLPKGSAEHFTDAVHHIHKEHFRLKVGLIKGLLILYFRVRMIVTYKYVKPFCLVS